MTFPGALTFPGPTRFPGGTTYQPGSYTYPYLSVGTWQSAGVDAAGVLWITTGITGWDDPPPAREGYVTRPNAHGAFDAPVYDDPKVITWTGAVRAPDPLSCAAAKQQLGSLARTLRDGTVIIGHKVDADTEVHAKRAPGWNLDGVNPYEFDYQAIVTCVDPYRYGPPVVAVTPLASPGAGGLILPLGNASGFLDFGAPGNPGRVSLYNSGTTETYETFTITGPVLGGLTLTDAATGRQIVYQGDVASSGTLTIDPSTGRATLNNSDRTGLLVTKQWWSVPAGSVSTVQFATLGSPIQSGYLTATLQPAYE